MESLIYKFFVGNWQRKLVALLAAIVIWLFVNQQITDRKTIRNVPIRIVNLPADKTIVGLLPNGILQKRISLNLSGTKDVVDELEPGDLEVLIDASTIDHNDWIAQITKKNLVSLNPSIDLSNNITEVDHAEFVLKLNRLLTVKIPVTILPPIGEPPVGYEFLDVWPQTLMQTVSGPEEELQKLKAKGLEITFDLNAITKEDLDAIKAVHDDEISFLVPSKWKQVVVPFRNNAVEEINDPEVLGLRVDFLRKSVHPVDKEVPIRVFYPLKTSTTLNSEKIPLVVKEPLKSKNGLTIFSVPLFAKNVSRLFVDVIKENIELVITAAPKEERDTLLWSYEVINPHQLEDVYVASMIASSTHSKNAQNSTAKKREVLLRQRFRDYLQCMVLCISPEHKLSLESKIDGASIKLISY